MARLTGRTGRSVVRILHIARPTAGKPMALLEDCGLLVGVTGRDRGRMYH